MSGRLTGAREVRARRAHGVAEIDETADIVALARQDRVFGVRVAVYDLTIQRSQSRQRPRREVIDGRCNAVTHRGFIDIVEQPDEFGGTMQVP